MQLVYSSLNLLQQHLTYVRSVFSSGSAVLVGGAVRDILLGISTNPTDIDLTMPGHPDDIWNASLRSEGSWFRTQKYGTMTHIVTGGHLHLGESTQDTSYQYECTPLRQEGGYQDHRHPEEIVWSGDIVADAARRDFTINCLYYTFCDFQDLHDLHDRESSLGVGASGTLNPQDPALKDVIPKQPILKDLIPKDLIPKEHYRIDVDHRCVMLHDHALIGVIFPQGHCNQSALISLLSQSGLSGEQLGGVRHCIIDPYGGIVDLENGVLRSVGNPDRRFAEDALRLLRALRIINVLNCRLYNSQIFHDIDIDAQTRKSIKKNYYQIQYIAKERIKDEILKVFAYHNPFGFVSLLEESGMLKYIFPAVAATKGVNQPIRYHPLDTYHHTIMTLRNLQQINASPLVKLGMLYHDVGKTEQYHTYSIGLTKEEMHEIQGSRLNHSVCGADLCERDLESLGFPRAMTQEVCRYVRHHMEPGQILSSNNTKKIKKIRLRYSEFGESRVRNLFDICKADRLGQYNPIQAHGVQEVQELYDILDTLIASEGQFTRKQLAINGHDLMDHFGLPPGPVLKTLLDKSFERVSVRIESRNTKDVIFAFLKGVLNQI